MSDVEVVIVGDISCLPSERSWNYSCMYVSIIDEHPNIKRNVGIRMSVGKHIAFVDDDAYLSCGWVSRALHLIDEKPDYIFTGPEKPTRNNPISVEIYESQKLWICEFSSSHVNFNDKRVPWSDVPFCNCIIPRKYFDRQLLDEKIPWDMDDFHFFSGLDPTCTFLNDAKLLVFHDRYKDSLLEHLKYKWRLRSRTGEKLITHFNLYRKVPMVTLTLVSPIILLILFLVDPILVLFTFCIYILFILQQCYLVSSPQGVSPYKKSKIVFLIHMVTLIAFFFGVFRKLFEWISLRTPLKSKGTY